MAKPNNSSELELMATMSHLLCRWLNPLIAFCGFITLLMVVNTAQADTRTVVNLNDSGEGSLRQTIADADSGDTIRFSQTLPEPSDTTLRTITLMSQIVLDKDLTIDGEGRISLSGGNTNRHFSVDASNVIIDNMVLQNGRDDTRGGSIEIASDADVRIKNSTLVANSVDVTDQHGYGGAVYNEGTLFILNSTLTENSITTNNSNFNSSGGGIYNLGELNVLSTTFVQNSVVGISRANGGGFFNAAGAQAAIIYHSTFSDNQRITRGGLESPNGVHGEDGSSTYLVFVTINDRVTSGADSTSDSIPVTLYNSIFRTCNGKIDFQGFNFTRFITDCSEGSATSYDKTDLRDLADNGCVTKHATLTGLACVKTHALGIDNAAIDAATDAYSSFYTVDQRGITRPQGDAHDSGAFELVTTTVNLSATENVMESGKITYTASLTHRPETDLMVTLSSGRIIEISAGELTGTIEVLLDNDVYVSDNVSDFISAAEGGRFDNLVIDVTPAITTITDVDDVTELSLSATEQITEGQLITYTVNLSNDAGSDMTVTLASGAKINIFEGEESGQAELLYSNNVYIDSSVSDYVASTVGGNFESIRIDSSPTETIVDDVIDVITVDLSATDAVVEGGTITYTATLSNPAREEAIVTLLSGDVIMVNQGEISGTVDVMAADDVYLGGGRAQGYIVGAVGGGFERLAISGTSSAITELVDDRDVTLVNLTASESVIEGESITYTVTTSSPTGTSMAIALSNGAIIDIAAGQSSGSTTVDTNDDAYLGNLSTIVTIESVTGGNFEDTQLTPSLGVTTQITDDRDTTTVSLTATQSVVEGESITYTANLTNPAVGAVTVTLDSGIEISIVDGESIGSVTVLVDDDVYLGNESASDFIDTALGGSFEHLQVDATPATTNVFNRADSTVVSLSAPESVVEGGSITYTASLSNVADGIVIVTLGDGELIIIADGDTTGTVEIPTDDNDELGDGRVSTIIATARGGNFEQLDVDGTSAEIIIVDNDDDDADTIANLEDNCPYQANPDQADHEGDGIGDVCDADADGDGMPNTWEQDNNLDPFDSLDQDADADNDGFTNAEEYEFGTDPNLVDSDDNINGIPDSVEEHKLNIVPILKLLLLDDEGLRAP